MPRATQGTAIGYDKDFRYGALTLYGRPFQNRSPIQSSPFVLRPYNPARTSRTVWALPRSLAATKGISKLISLPAGTEMFQFPAFAPNCLCIHHTMGPYYRPRVSPFGHPRIYAYSQLPGAFRSLPRPSSLSDAKAFTICPY